MRSIKDAADDLAAVLKGSARVFDQIEQRGRRFSRLSSAALHAIIGISASYLIAYGATFALDVNILVTGTLGAGILGPIGVLVSRRRHPGTETGGIFEGRLDQAQQLVDFLEQNTASLPQSTQLEIQGQIGRLLGTDHTPQLALPPPVPPAIPQQPPEDALEAG